MVSRVSVIVRSPIMNASYASNANVAVALLLALSHGALSLTLNATDFANRLAGHNITIVKSTLILASPKQADLFTKANRADGIGFTSGVVLSSAWASEEVGKNDNVYSPGSDNLNGTGYPALDKMLPAGIVSMDACVLQIMFKCQNYRPTVSFEFVYGTEEYPFSSTGSGNKDVMGAFLGGEEPKHNIALLYGQDLTRKDSAKVSAPFKSNVLPMYRTEMNGFTPPITASSATQWGSTVNVLHIAVADTGAERGPLTRYNGAWMFIKSGSLTCTSTFEPVDIIDDDYYYYVEGTEEPSLSPYPSASPYPSTPQPTQRPSTGGSQTMEPTLFPTEIHMAPTTAGECAEYVWSKCRKCGYRTCYYENINDKSGKCIADESIDKGTYVLSVLKRIKPRYC